VGTFVDQLFVNLPEATYGNDAKRENIVTNVLSTVFQTGVADQMEFLQGEPKTRVAQRVQDFHSTQVTSDRCVCSTMNLWMLSPCDEDGAPDPTKKKKYQVASMQNEAPLQVMQKSREELAQEAEAGSLQGLKGQLFLSKEFDTLEEAIDYFKKAKPYVADGSLFKSE